jgi:hypothetical protein
MLYQTPWGKRSAKICHILGTTNVYEILVGLHDKKREAGRHRNVRRPVF